MCVFGLQEKVSSWISVPSGFKERRELKISVSSDSEILRFSEFVIFAGFRVFEICRFSDFVTSCDFLDFEIFQFCDFFGFAGLRDFSIF